MFVVDVPEGLVLESLRLTTANGDGLVVSTQYRSAGLPWAVSVWRGSGDEMRHLVLEEQFRTLRLAVLAGQAASDKFDALYESLLADANGFRLLPMGGV